MRRFSPFLILVTLMAALLPTVVLGAMAGPTLTNVLTIDQTIPQGPVFLRLIEVTAPAGSTLRSQSAGMVYGLDGAAAIALPGKAATNVGTGAALALPGGGEQTVQIGSGPARFLFFSIVPSAQGAPATFAGSGATEHVVYTSAATVTDLAPGPYDFTVQRAVWEPNAPLTGPHHRTGIGLYYIIAGTYTIETGGQMRDVPAGGTNLEGKGEVHRNVNRTNAPVQAVFFTLTPKGQPIVVQDAPTTGAAPQTGGASTPTTLPTTGQARPDGRNPAVLVVTIGAVLLIVGMTLRLRRTAR